MIWFALAAGMCIGSGICHLALGLKRPLHMPHITFALMMVVICPFQFFAGRLSEADSMTAVVNAARGGVALAIVFMTLFGVFIRQYSGITIPRAVAYAFFAANAAWLTYDLLSPSGLFFTSLMQLELEMASQALKGVTSVPTSIPALGWHAFNSIIALWGVIAGWRMAQGARRRHGIVLMLAVVPLLATVLFDAARDVVGSEWPFLGGFGVMIMAMVLSADLALSFREREIMLEKMLARDMQVRDQLNTPLQTMQIALELMQLRQTSDHVEVGAMRRSLDRLISLGDKLRPPVDGPRA